MKTLILMCLACVLSCASAFGQTVDVNLVYPDQGDFVTVGSFSFGFEAESSGGTAPCYVYVSNTSSDPFSSPMSGYPRYAGDAGYGASMSLPTPSSLPSDCYTWGVEVRIGTNRYRSSINEFYRVSSANDPWVTITDVNIRDNDVDIEWSIDDDDYCDDLESRWRLDNSSWSSWSSSTDASYNNLSYGDHTFEVQVRDYLGAMDSDVEDFTLTAPNHAPSVVLASPSNGTVTSDATPTFYFSIDDADGDYITTRIYLSSTCSTPRSCPIFGYPMVVSGATAPGTWSFTPPSNLAPGYYSWEVSVSDGQVTVYSSPPRGITITNPNTAPSFSNLAPADNYRTTNPNVQFGYGVGDAECNLTSVQLYVATGTSDPYTNPMSGYPKTVPGSGCGTSNFSQQTVPVGQYRWGLRATDAGGLVTNSGARTLYVDANQQPTVTLLAPPHNSKYASDALPTLSFTATDPENSQLQYAVYVSTTCSPPHTCPMSGFPVSGSMSSGTTVNVPWTQSIPPGYYVWDVRINDGVNTVYSSMWGFTINEPNHPPTVAIGDIQIVGTNGVHVCWIGADPDPGQGMTYRFKLDADAWSNWSTQTCANYTNLPEGVHTFYVEVQDTPGATSADQKQFSISNPGPTISVTDGTTMQSDWYTLKITANDNSGIQGYVLDPYGDGTASVNYVAGDVTYIYANDGVFHPKVTVVANDGQTAQATFTLTVEEYDPGPPSEDHFYTTASIGTAMSVHASLWDHLSEIPEANAMLKEMIQEASQSKWKPLENPNYIFNGQKLSQVSETISREAAGWHLEVRLYDKVYALGDTRHANEFLIIMKKTKADPAYDWHNGEYVNVKIPGEPNLRYKINMIGNEPSGFAAFKPVMEIGGKEAGAIITDLNKVYPAFEVDAKWADLQAHPEMYNLEGVRLNMVKVPMGDVPGKGWDTRTAMLQNAEEFLDQKPFALEGLEGAKSNRLAYLLSGGRFIARVVGDVLLAVAVYDIVETAYQGDYQGAVCKASGLGAGIYAVAYVETACQPYCLASTAVGPEGTVACEAGCFLGAMVAGAIATFATDKICNAFITISWEGGQKAFQLTKQEVIALHEEMDRIHKPSPTQIILATNATYESGLAALSSGQILHVFDSTHNPILPMDTIVTFTSYLTQEGMYKEVLTLLNAYSGEYTIELDTQGVNIDSTFTLTYASTKYDTVAANIQFRNVPSSGYQFHLHVNQAPNAKFAYQVGGVPTVITDTVTIGPSTTLTVYPQLSYDPDGDALLDFSLDIMGDNIWEISQLTNFTQGIDLQFDTLGVYPVVLRVRDQYQLSGFDTIFVEVAVPTDVDDESKLPTTFSLAQNYPNPFNPTTTISFSLAHRCDVQLQVLNVLGQEVNRWDFSSLSAGDHQVVWDASSRSGKPVSSGVYFYRLRTSDFTSTKKMLLLR